jgi:probable O-glycosylation ligase (exosortase A-associated)
MTILFALSVKRRWLSLTAWFAVGIFILAIVGSQSRGATLGLAAVAAFLWLFSKRKVASLMGITLAAMIMVFYASDSYFERMSSIRTYQTEGSAQGRIMAWKAGTRMALDNPILGVGAGSFAIAFGTTHRPPEIAGPMPWLTAHSSYFLVLGELGFPGIVAFMALVIGGFRSTMAVRQRVVQAPTGSRLTNGIVTSQALYLMSAGMIGFAVAGAFLSAAYYPHIFVLTALLYCARTIALAELERASAPSSKLEPASVRRKIVAPGRARLRTGRGSGT